MDAYTPETLFQIIINEKTPNNKMRRTIIIITILTLLISNIQSKNKVVKSKYLPDYAKFQFAGNIGFVSMGGGYSFLSDRINMDLMYGFVPESEGGDEIHSITQKNTFGLYSHNIKHLKFMWTTGFFINYEAGENSYVTLPDHYPDDYYSPNAFHFGLFIGLKAQRKIPNKYIHKLDYFAEIGTLAKYAYYNVLAEEDRYHDIFSLAVGINLHF